jgi:hemerythrin
MAGREFFEWDPAKLSVGVDAMDGQHQRLIGMINQIYAASERPPNLEANVRAFDALVQYAGMHFQQEEALMEREKFPGLKVHKIVHEDLVKKLHVHRENLIKEQGRIGTALMSFLKVWLTGHIMGVDTQYGKHIHEAHRGEKR